MSAFALTRTAWPGKSVVQTRWSNPCSEISWLILMMFIKSWLASVNCKCVTAIHWCDNSWILQCVTIPTNLLKSGRFGAGNLLDLPQIQSTAVLPWCHGRCWKTCDTILCNWQTRSLSQNASKCSYSSFGKAKWEHSLGDTSTVINLLEWVLGVISRDKTQLRVE